MQIMMAACGRGVQPWGARRVLDMEDTRRSPSARRCRLRRQVGAAAPDRPGQRDLLVVPRGPRVRRTDPRGLRLGHLAERQQEGLVVLGDEMIDEASRMM